MLRSLTRTAFGYNIGRTSPFSGETTRSASSHFCLFSLWVFKTGVCSPLNKFFLLTGDPILQRFLCQGKQAGSHNFVLIFESGVKLDDANDI